MSALRVTSALAALLQLSSCTRGIQCSMSRKGNCWDNAVGESFFSITGPLRKH